MATKEVIDEAIAIIENHRCVDNVKRPDITRFIKLSITSDLSECSFEAAIGYFAGPPFNEKPKILLCSQVDAVLAGRLAQIHGCSVIAMPGIPDDCWAVCGDNVGVYSPGM